MRELLADKQWHKNYELAAEGGLSFHGSLYALRQQGWLIETRYIRRGLWAYRLTGQGEPRAKRKMSEREARIARLYLAAREGKEWPAIVVAPEAWTGHGPEPDAWARLHETLGHDDRYRWEPLGEE